MQSKEGLSRPLGSCPLEESSVSQECTCHAQSKAGSYHWEVGRWANTGAQELECFVTYAPCSWMSVEHILMAATVLCAEVMLFT